MVKYILFILFLWGPAFADPNFYESLPPEGQLETNYWNGNATLRMKDGTTYVIPAPVLTPEIQKQLSQLSHEEFIKFCENRAGFLQALGRLLHFKSRLRFGLGTMVKNRFYQILRPFNRNEKDLHPVEYLLELQQGPPKENTKISKSIEKTKEILRLIDYQLWQAPKLIARQNEFGAALFAGGGAGLMVRSKNWGFFQSLGIGISFGYNSDAKALVINVFKNVDTALKALTLIGPTIPVKVQVYFATRDWADGGITVSRGRGEYPPGPFDVQLLPESIYFGVGMPSLDSLYGYEARTSQYSIVNIAISRLFPGFIKIGSNADDIFKDGYDTVHKIARKILDFFRPSNGQTCENIFL